MCLELLRCTLRCPSPTTTRRLSTTRLSLQATLLLVLLLMCTIWFQQAPCSSILITVSSHTHFFNLNTLWTPTGLTQLRAWSLRYSIALTTKFRLWHSCQASTRWRTQYPRHSGARTRHSTCCTFWRTVNMQKLIIDWSRQMSSM